MTIPFGVYTVSMPNRVGELVVIGYMLYDRHEPDVTDSIPVRVMRVGEPYNPTSLHIARYGIWVWIDLEVVEGDSVVMKAYWNRLPGGDCAGPETWQEVKIDRLACKEREPDRSHVRRVEL